MAEQTGISWTDSTFNPWIGCTKVSPGCDHCYAEALMDHRMHRVQWGPQGERSRTSKANWAQPLRWNARPFFECPECHWRGDAPGNVNGMAFCPQPRCAAPLQLARRRVFCASLADVFDNAVPPSWRADLFDLIERTPNLDWLLLTKRIGNVSPMMIEVARSLFWMEHLGACHLPTNVWLGASIVNQAEADRDIPKLLATPARVRFLSCEPLLGPISFEGLFATPSRTNDGANALEELGWVIVGGESGQQARPMHPDWARSLRDQCAAAGVPFFFKQWGEWAPRGPESMGYRVVDGVPRVRLTDAGQNGQWLGAEGGNDCWMNRAGKAITGDRLDGQQHQQWPALAQAGDTP